MGCCRVALLCLCFVSEYKGRLLPYHGEATLVITVLYLFVLTKSHEVVLRKPGVTLCKSIRGCSVSSFASDVCIN